MTEDDLKRLQDGFLESSKRILLEHGRLVPVGFVITLHKHLDALFESGYGLEFIDPKSALRDTNDDTIATLIIDLSMNWKKLYHAVLAVFPKTQSVLPNLLALGAEIKVDDPYKRVMRPFMTATHLDEKDIIAATMRQICDKADAFASIFHSEAWQRALGPEEKADKISDLGADVKSVEIIVSSMETYSFARMVTVPIHRAAPKKKRDDGKVKGFGQPNEMIDRPENNNVLGGRMFRFLKPRDVAS